MKRTVLLALLLALPLAPGCGGGGDSELYVEREASFALPRPDGCAWPACAHPRALGLADFDGDGYADLVAGGTGSGDLWWLAGDGAGGFVVGPTLAGLGGTRVDLLEVGQFDAGNVPDLAVVDVDANAVRILLGDGSGGFAPAPNSPFPLPGAGLPVRLAVGPAAGTARDDLVVVDDTGHASVLLAGADGALSVAAGSPFFLADPVGDALLAAMDDDALPDLVVADADSGTIVFFQGQGDGTFVAVGTPVAVGSAPGALAAEFFDLGPVPDLAVLDAAAGTVHVLLGVGDGSFVPAATRPPIAGVGEGLDVVPLVHPLAPNYPAHLLALVRRPDGRHETVEMLNPGDGRFADGGTRAVLRGQTDRLHVAPLSEDGVSDVAWPDMDGGFVRVRFGRRADL